jgi:hypothetical protein
MPAEITAPDQGLEHELANDLPVGREMNHVDTEPSKGSVRVLLYDRTQKAVIKAND